MKKTFLSIVLIFSLSTRSYAFDPITIPALYYGAAALGLGAAGAGVYCAMKEGVPSTVDVAGTIYRKASVAWVALSTANLPALMNGNLTVSKTLTQIFGHAQAKPTVYPKLAAAVKSSDTPLLLSGNMTASQVAVGSTVTMPDGTSRTITEMWYGSGMSMYDNCSNPRDNGNGVWIVGLGAGAFEYDTQQCGVSRYYSQTAFMRVSGETVTPTVRPATASEFKQKVAPSGTVTDSGYQAEIDAMMKDATYVPTFTDDTTGLPFAYPPGALTPSQVEAYNQTGVAADKRDAALTAANNAVASAQSIYDAAQSRLAGSPNDPVLIAAADRAKSALDKAKTDAANIEASNATTAARDAEKVADAESVSGFTLPAVRSFSWASLESLKGVMSTAFPFYLIPRLGSLYGQIVPEEPTAPSFSLPVFGQTYSISLSMFDPLAMAIRSFIAVAASAAAIVAMVKFYRG